MAEYSSGLYIIDDEYNIISFNERAAQIYSGICNGEKCYKCLLGYDAPCKDCLVVSGSGSSYIDPVNRIYESADSVDIPLSDGKSGHVIIVNQVQEDNLKNVVASGKDGRHLLGVIGALSNDVSDLYEVDRASRNVSVYRMAGDARGVAESLSITPKYEEAIEAYISRNVHPDDCDYMRSVTNFDIICNEVDNLGNFHHHYRILRDGEIHFYYLKCVANNDSEGEGSIVFAFGCEDSLYSQKAIKNTRDTWGSRKRRKVLVVDDNETFVL